jgi:hypothetical protein
VSSTLLRVSLDRGSHFEITPEPTAEERAAILAALEQLQADERAPGRWWEAGVRESIQGDEDES